MQTKTKKFTPVELRSQLMIAAGQAIIVEGKLKGDGRHCRHLQGLAQGWSETQKI
ncbi:MAG: hypothetical protein JRF56_03870 [Deltaproteobacteria bacterium]|jgi:hypothetical protein|nr:hypothetical protein [Deltaproteobacteria bacterium]